jgi:YYY domain-containing protein
MEFGLVLVWVLAFGALTAGGAPLAAALFANLPRKGAPFALPTALVAFTIVVFWVGQVTFGAHTVAFAALVVVAAGALAHRLGARPDWTSVSRTYGVFLLAFVAFAVVRATVPGITPAGGEQFLHFGLVKTILASGSLPPEDFWFAGEPMRYYYGTQLQVAAFSALTGTPPRYGFNLGIAAFYGLLVVTAYGVAGSVVASAGRSYRLGGIMGAFFVAVGGATTTAIRLLTPLLPEGIRRPVAEAAFGFMARRFERGDLDAAVAQQGSTTEWSWWFTRYVVPDTLQEFPLYSFVKADLHGHALANGYVLFAAALAFAYYRTPAEQRARRLGILFGGLGAVAGLFGFMNTWSLPTAAGLTLLGVAAADAHPATLLPADLAERLLPAGSIADDPGLLERLLAEAWRIVLAVVVAALVVAVGVVIASPFLVFGSVPTNGGAGLLPPTTSLPPFLVIYGGVLAIAGAVLLHRSVGGARESGPLVPAVGAAVVLASVLVGWLASIPILAVTAPLIAAGWWLVRTERMGFEAVLLVAGIGLVLSMDLVHAKVWPPQQERWNTTLKVAVQGWTLLGVGAGAAGALALADARDALAARFPAAREVGETDAEAATDGGRDLGSVAAPVVVALLVVAVLLASTPFAVLVFQGTVEDDVRNPDRLTLDGLAVHDTFNGEEIQAIYWLDDRQGTPTIVEAPGHQTYSWTNPASTFAGADAVVGWDHQRGYRGSVAFECRAERADQVYTGPMENAAAVLLTYEVDYVYVGTNERDAYGGEIRDFGAHPAFEEAFENDAATIYRVDRSALPDRERLQRCPRAG